MLRLSRGAGFWQYSGNPRSYCGHRPCTTNEYGRPPHCSFGARPFSADASQNDGDHDSAST